MLPKLPGELIELVFVSRLARRYPGGHPEIHSSNTRPVLDLKLGMELDSNRHRKGNFGSVLSVGYLLGSSTGVTFTTHEIQFSGPTWLPLKREGCYSPSARSESFRCLEATKCVL